MTTGSRSLEALGCLGSGGIVLAGTNDRRARLGSRRDHKDGGRCAEGENDCERTLLSCFSGTFEFRV